jgi:hypothetical protein
MRIALIGAALLISSNTALAQGPQRSWGLGTTIGAGYALASVATYSGTSSATAQGIAVSLPTLDARFFLGPTLSIDCSMSVTNMAIIMGVTKSFYMITDVFLAFNFGSGTVRGIVAPGLGFEILGGGGIGIAAKVPVRIGVEFLTAARGFGFQILARPYFAYAHVDVSGSAGSGVGGGVLGELGFIWYGVR